MSYKFLAINKSTLYKEACKYFGLEEEYISITKYSMGEVKPTITIDDNLNIDQIFLFMTFDRTKDINTEIYTLLLSINAIKLNYPNLIDIHLVMPYLPYSRQDRAGKGEPKSLHYFINLLKAAGISNILSWDIHNSKVLRMYPDIHDLYSIEPTVNSILLYRNRIKATSLTLVAPDKGATTTVNTMKTYINNKVPNLPVHTIICNKTRLPDRSVMTKIPEYTSYSTGLLVIVDDIIDTGHTILGVLNDFTGFKDKKIYVSHGILNTDNIEILNNTITADTIYPLDKTAVYSINRYIIDYISCFLLYR